MGFEFFSVVFSIDVNYVVLETIDNYIELQKGDKIVKDEDNSSIIIYHDENGNKSACLESGVVRIERNLKIDLNKP